MELQGRNVKIIVYLGKPFHKCFVRFQREGNIKTTIVDSFATIFLLFYVKILIACTDLIAITKIYNVYGDYVCTYLSGMTCLLQIDSWLLAGKIITVLNLMILPVVLMLLYTMRCFRKCLGKFCYLGHWWTCAA